MLSKQKPSMIGRKIRLSHTHLSLATDGNKLAGKTMSVNHPLMSLVAKLKEENAKLRATVQFFQDLYLLDD